MAKIDRNREAELMDAVISYGRECRKRFEEDLFRQRKERHQHEEVYFKGTWVPMNMIVEVQRRVARRSSTIFWEMLGLLAFLLFCSAAFWVLFKRFFLF